VLGAGLTTTGAGLGVVGRASIEAEPVMGAGLTRAGLGVVGRAGLGVLAAVLIFDWYSCVCGGTADAGVGVAVSADCWMAPAAAGCLTDTEVEGGEDSFVVGEDGAGTFSQITRGNQPFSDQISQSQHSTTHHHKQRHQTTTKTLVRSYSIRMVPADAIVRRHMQQFVLRHTQLVRSDGQAGGRCADKEIDSLQSTTATTLCRRSLSRDHVIRRKGACRAARGLL
jgi:hypothetical protein